MLHGLQKTGYFNVNAVNIIMKESFKYSGEMDWFCKL